MESLRIIVLGDVGVGKSSFLKGICENFYHMYPINSFDYFTYPSENNKKQEKHKSRRIKWKKKPSVETIEPDPPSQENEQLDEIIEATFFQAKKNFLEFIENKINAGNTFVNESHKQTFGFDVFTFLWDKHYTHYNRFVKGIHNHQDESEQQAQNRQSSFIHDSDPTYEGNQYYLNNSNTVIIEFFEIGGAQTYACIRSIFYKKFDGIMLVYDSSNVNSFNNLARWLYELHTRTKPPSEILYRNNKNKSNSFWKIINKPKEWIYSIIRRKTDKEKKEDINLDEEKELNIGKNTYNRTVKKMFKEIEDDEDANFSLDDVSDIEKGERCSRTDLLKDEIPIACVATKIDIKSSKKKPKSIKTLKHTSILNYLFSTSEYDIYDKNEDIKSQKDTLKQLGRKIVEASEIKSSSIDGVVDMDLFIEFLNKVYNQKYK